jgi:phytoene synthase
MPASPEASAARTLALLYSTVAERPVLAALWAIEKEIGASLRSGLDHQVAHSRLAWWREECTRCAAGQPRHPLTRSLRAALPPGATGALGGLTGLVDAAAWDLAAATFGTRRELRAYCERWAGAVIAPLLELAAPAAPSATARELGAALRELELLAHLARDARAGRLRLPLDELAALRAEPAAVARPPWPPPLAARLRERHQELRAALGAAVRSLTPAVQPALRGLLVWAALACAHSRRAAQRLPAAPAGSDHHSPLDAWRAWRAARRADAGRLAL